MDGYPVGSLDHNAPLLIASGLNETPPDAPFDFDGDDESDNQCLLVKSDLPLLRRREADVLQAYFGEINARRTAWTSFSRDEPYRFRIRALGRSFLLPSRRAKLPELVEQPESTPILHSPFSPLSPVSKLYPDGLINSQWIRKHQELVPCIYACFYNLSKDDQLGTEIGEFKRKLTASGYKTRLVIIFMGTEDDDSALSDSVQDQLESVRRSAGLDPKSIFYIPVQESPAELRRVMDSILSAWFGTAIDYYRDLGRHARKKRSRGITPRPTVPPTSGTSRTLSLPDWNFRYDFKAAVFASFRQEADAAIRSFEQAYEILLGSDLLDLMPSWSTRWNEARQLSDIITIRCLRIQLWVGNTTLAVRRWQSHRERIGDFVDRRGQGTNTYGWQAWEARWATVMAELVEGVPALIPPTLFLPAEKAVLGERLKPWELLHHAGYWHRMAARHMASRRTLAHAMPDEDRVAPDAQSLQPGKPYGLDTYMCPAPHQEYPLTGEGVNYSRLVVDCLMAARSQFQAYGQPRLTAEISIECARELASMESWEEAMTLLQPMWADGSFRSEEWLRASEDLCWIMRSAAVATGRADVVVSIDWELLHRRFPKRPQWHYDLGKSLDGVKADNKPVVHLTDDSVPSFVSASFVFRHKESKAGEMCTAQVALTSEAHPGSPPVTLSSMTVQFEGSIKPITIEHEAFKGNETTDSGTLISALNLDERFPEDSDGELPSEIRGRTDLSLRPGQIRVLEMAIPLREAGVAEAASVTLSYRSEAFDLDYIHKFRETDRPVGWFVDGSRQARRPRVDAHMLQIQPRPPKMHIGLVDAREQYYKDEAVHLQVEFRNDEDEAANVKLDVHMFGRLLPSFQVVANGDEHAAEGGEAESRTRTIPLGRLAKGASLEVPIRIDKSDTPVVYELHIRATYHLESDAATPIIQVLPLPVNVVAPFEANYDLVPRLHQDPWPSLFDPEGLQEVDEGLATHARGFAQKWCLLCHYASFATEELRVTETDLRILSSGEARCSIVDRPEMAEGGLVAAPKTMHEARFDLVAQKLRLDDRHPVTLDLDFVIKWQRRTAAGDGAVNTTTMPAGQYLVLGTEPRVLASVLHAPPEAWPSLMHVDLTIENPSHHFLTFGLTMDPSDTFAFSGTKQTTMHLLPMSRRTTRYRLLPLVTGTYLRPGLVVRDKYFQKILRIIPTEGMKIDKDGLLIWVPGDSPEGSDADVSDEAET
ncbi:hypothetical protein RJ55_00910 [Drechmeria coniospora]|nr:hypothetical protein RJ55_00910 [Drechmeria coniospora]